MARTKRPSAEPKNSSKQKPWEDKALRQLYAERDKYAAEFGFDLDRIFADLKRREAKSQMRKPIYGPTSHRYSLTIPFRPFAVAAGGGPDRRPRRRPDSRGGYAQT